MVEAGVSEDLDKRLPEVSVVVPMLDAVDTIHKTLGGLAAQEADAAWEVIVVDNGSTDGSRSVAEGFAGRLPLKVVDGSERRGIGYAKNVGASHAKGPFLAFTDADDVVGSGWLQAMVDAARRGVALIGGRIDYVSLLPTDAVVPPRIGVLDHLPRPLGFLPFALGCNCGVSRRAFDAVGGFDTDLMRGEDVSFCWRIQLAGFPMVYSDDIVVHYRLRTDLQGLLRQQFGNGEAVPLLYRMFRSQGAGRPPVRRAVKRWVLLVVALPLVPLSRRRRWMWLRDVAHQVGRLTGCLRWRVFCP